MRAGRRREFAQFPEFQDESLQSRIPDPQAPGTFASSKLDWNAMQAPEHRQWLQLYRQLLAVRHASIIPLLPWIEGSAATATISSTGMVDVQWRVTGRGVLRLILNLSEQPAAACPPDGGQVLWQEGQLTPRSLSAWFVRWTLLPSGEPVDSYT